MKIFMTTIYQLIKIIYTFLLTLIPPWYKVDFHAIANITSPQQVIFKNRDEIILIQDSDILIYHIAERKIEKVGEREPNDFVGVSSDGDIILCSIEHFLINSYDEYSTKFTIRKSGGEIEKEMEFFETIKPIYLDEKRIVAVTAMDFLQQHQYEINLSNGEMKEEIFQKEKVAVRIPKNFNLKNTYLFNKDMYVIEDVFGNLCLYRTLF